MHRRREMTTTTRKVAIEKRQGRHATGLVHHHPKKELLKQEETPSCFAADDDDDDDGTKNYDEMSSSTKVMKPNTYALMVHKLYVDRVVNYLTTTTTAQQSSSSSFLLSVATQQQQKEEANNNNDEYEYDDDGTNNSRSGRAGVTVLDTQPLTGVSRARRGFVLLLIEFPSSTSSSSSSSSSKPSHAQNLLLLKQLSPMARQNISMTCHITHSYTADSTTTSQEGRPSSDLGERIWKTMATTTTTTNQNHQDFGPTKDKLRVDVYLRGGDNDSNHHDNEEKLHRDLCRQLQRAAAAAGRDGSDLPSNNLLDDDPFTQEGGPIFFTKSRSKCTRRLSVIVIVRRRNEVTTENTNTTTIDYYWGWEKRRCNNDQQNSILIMDLKLNHEAAEEIIVRPCNNYNNQNTTVDDEPIPLSRAFYKLTEVWDTYLKPHKERLRIGITGQTCVGLDLGASPGGWTQVMVHKMRLSHVVAVDAGQLGERITTKLQPPQVVTHLVSSMESANLQQPYGPYSVIACDASMLWCDLLDNLMSTVLQKEGVEWSLPSTWVITTKLPFKTRGSIARQLQQLNERLPTYLNDMMNILYPPPSTTTDNNKNNNNNNNPRKKVKIAFRVVHLMANSISERTLIVIFEEEDNTSLMLN